MSVQSPPTLPQSFCALSWRYAQVDLQRGKVKACCKTPFHRVSLEELRRKGAGAIFNNTRFQDRRREMLRGEYPSDCEPCWDHERLGVPSYRRTVGGESKFSTPSTVPDALTEVSLARPTHLELILATTCDLRCVYCDPNFSSAWEAEARQHGLKAVDGLAWDMARAPTDFADAFWDWFSEIAPTLRYLQFNGGEPLIQPEFHRALDRLVAVAPRSLQLGVITNLNTPKPAFDRFMTRLPDLLERFDLRIAVSQDSLGRRAEYIRFGLNWERFGENLEKLACALRPSPLHLAPTLSALSVSSFADFIDYIGQLADRTGARFFWRPSIVHQPASMSPFVVGAPAVKWLEAAAQSAQRWGWPELQRWAETVAVALHNADIPARGSAARIFQDLDKRRRTSMEAHFPELSGLL